MSGIGLGFQCYVCFDTGRIPHGDCTGYCWCQSGREVYAIDQKSAMDGSRESKPKKRKVKP